MDRLRELDAYEVPIVIIGVVVGRV
jgi:hypothetical protein